MVCSARRVDARADGASRPRLAEADAIVSHFDAAARMPSQGAR
jgi:hypothetical protein